MSSFEMSTLDIHGHRGSNYTDYIGKQFVHTGNNYVYTVDRIVWFGNTDEWCVEATRLGSDVACVRTVDNFFGNRQGKPRFAPIGS